MCHWEYLPTEHYPTRDCDLGPFQRASPSPGRMVEEELAPGLEVVVHRQHLGRGDETAAELVCLAHRERATGSIGLEDDPDVDLTHQTLSAYEGQELVRFTLVSTGLPRTPTPAGLFHIHTKMRYDDMEGDDYYLRKVPYVMYFYKGYALHGTYWHARFGRPQSHGCVNLPTEHAAWLYEWAEVGTLVSIHD